MDKREIIEKTKKAFQLYKENKIYQAFKEIYPVAQIVKTEKVQKLYKVLIIKAKQLLQDLYNNKNYNKLEEIEYMFFDGVNVPPINKIFEKNKEKRKQILEELKKEQPQEENFNLNDEQTIETELKNNHNDNSKDFEFNAENFKLSSFSEDEMGEQDVNALIQKGVSLYEVGDIENALVIWEQALQLQPNNDFLKDYIANARRELGQDAGFLENPDDAKLEDETIKPPQELPGEQDVHENIEDESNAEIIFDENQLSGELKRAIAIARSGDVDRAKTMLKNLLAKNEIEEEQYLKSIKFVSKIEREVGLSIVTNKIKFMLEENEFDKALDYFQQNKSKFTPEEANKIERQILQKKQEYSISQSLELELDEEPPQKFVQKETHFETDRELKKEPKIKRKNKPLSKYNTKKKSNLKIYFKTTFFFLLLIIILAVVIFYGIKVIQNNLQTQQTTFDSQTFQLHEKEKEKKNLYDRYIKEARHYFDLGDYLFSYYTYLHAERFGKLNDQQVGFLSKARRLMKQEGINKRKELKLAEKYYKIGKYEKALPHLKNLLTENPEDLEIKDKLYNCYKKIAINYALHNDVVKAKTYFNYAIVLNRNDEEIPKHLKVLNRYLKGKINQKLLTQWFYFYIK